MPCRVQQHPANPGSQAGPFSYPEIPLRIVSLPLRRDYFAEYFESDVIKYIPLVKTCDARDARGQNYNQQWRHSRSGLFVARALDGRLADWSMQDFSPHFLMSYRK